MYFSDKYKDHNLALDKFSLIFNNYASSLPEEKLLMKVQKIENFRDDGCIVFIKDSIKIKYDFEKRFSYYSSFGSFSFDELGQFERKISKPEIALSIQCSEDETGFVFAWHSDYLNEEKKFIKSKTSSGFEGTAKRFTKKFIELDVYFSISGILTYETAKDLKLSVKKIPSFLRHFAN
jgi:hypothetical protein